MKERMGKLPESCQAVCVWGRGGVVYMGVEGSLNYQHPSTLAKSSYNHKDMHTPV